MNGIANLIVRAEHPIFKWVNGTSIRVNGEIELQKKVSSFIFTVSNKEFSARRSTTLNRGTWSAEVCRVDHSLDRAGTLHYLMLSHWIWRADNFSINPLCIVIQPPVLIILSLHTLSICISCIMCFAYFWLSISQSDHVRFLDGVVQKHIVYSILTIILYSRDVILSCTHVRF